MLTGESTLHVCEAWLFDNDQHASPLGLSVPGFTYRPLAGGFRAGGMRLGAWEPMAVLSASLDRPFEEQYAGGRIFKRTPDTE